MSTARADWKRTDTSLAWMSGDQPVWEFSFDRSKGKPYFHPMRIPDGPVVTDVQPKDHTWHYGLWFSWKLINGVNYWEEEGAGNRAEGKTAWGEPQFTLRDDGSATIKLEVSYTHPSGRVELRELRELTVSGVQPWGGYTIDWTSRFTAGDHDVVLSRTPMPGEPEGKVNGGYGGLGLRLAPAPLNVAYLTPEAEVTEFKDERARPSAGVLGINVSDATGASGSIAIFSHPTNIGAKAPWYIHGGMRFICAAVLAPRVRTLPAGSQWTLRYQVVFGNWTWSTEDLADAYTNWRSPKN